MVPKMQPSSADEPVPPAGPSHAPLTALLTGDKRPALVVLDADYTLWPFDCDKDVQAPFYEEQPAPCGPYDRYGRLSAPYIAVPHIVAALVDASIPIAITSRNPSAGAVSELLRAITIRPATRPEITNIWEALPSPLYFHAYSSGGYGKGKDRHFVTLRGLTGIPFKDMLFFDDLPENIAAAKAMGVTAVPVTMATGLTIEAFEAGLAEWRAKS
jgi:magnesium-dependent phosphatase-1